MSCPSELSLNLVFNHCYTRASNLFGLTQSELSMNPTTLDPQFESYLNDAPNLTYVQPTDSAWRRLLIDKLEVTLGRKKLESVYHTLKEADFDVTSFFTSAIQASEITINNRGIDPLSLNLKGPLILLANHPFGIIDGVVLCNIAAQLRGDLRILINSALCQDRDLAPYFLPIDFDNSRRAVKTNIRSKQLALQCLAEEIPVLIFPAGMVSTAGKFGLGSVVDAPWTTFAAKLVKEAKATVIPVYFSGQNSRKFHIASHLAEPLRMGMLMHEALNKFGDQIDVTVGSPIKWDQVAHLQSRQELTKTLYNCVQSLAPK